jgi:hypothetical protein
VIYPATSENEYFDKAAVEANLKTENDFEMIYVVTTCIVAAMNR